MVVEEANDQIVGDEQGSSADDSSQDAVILADDGVLHGVRQSQQDDQVKRVELDEFAFAGEPEANYQKRVDENWAKDLLRQGKSDDEHVFPSIVHNRIASSGCPWGFSSCGS